MLGQQFAVGSFGVFEFHIDSSGAVARSRFVNKGTCFYENQLRIWVRVACFFPVRG